jgi:hypothetical protein
MTLQTPSRRGLLLGLIAAPFVIRTAGLLMPVKALPKEWVPCFVDIEARNGLSARWPAETLVEYGKPAPWYLQLKGDKRDEMLMVYGARPQCLPADTRLLGGPVWNWPPHDVIHGGETYHHSVRVLKS